MVHHHPVRELPEESIPIRRLSRSIPEVWKPPGCSPTQQRGKGVGPKHTLAPGPIAPRCFAPRRTPGIGKRGVVRRATLPSARRSGALASVLRSVGVAPALGGRRKRVPLQRVHHGAR